MTRIDADAPAGPSADRRRRLDDQSLADAALTRVVIGAFYDVYNALGHGFLESVYATAMVRELRRRGLTVEREVHVVVRYKGEPVGHFRADVLVESRLVVELKASASTVPADRRQLLNYLRATNLEVGLLLSFGHRPTFCRVIATNHRASDPRSSAASAASSSPRGCTPP